MDVWLKRFIMFPILSMVFSWGFALVLGFLVGLLLGKNLVVPDAFIWLIFAIGVIFAFITTFLLTPDKKAVGVVNG